MITPNWTPLKRTIPVYDTAKPRFSMNTMGILAFNVAAYNALRSPAAVEMFYDESNGLIGITAADPDAPNALPVRKRSAGHQRTVTLMHFCTRFNIPRPKSTLTFPAPTFAPDGVLVLNYRAALKE